MAVTTPEWLARRGGQLRPGADGRTWAVYFAGEPQYLLAAVPAGGKFSCRITQTINGRRLDGGKVYPSLDDSVTGGLDELRQVLGW
jgi:hypothetical protein